MGKTTFKPSKELNQRLLAAFAFDAGVAEIDPTRDFLTVGTPTDKRNTVKFDVSGNDLK